MSQDLYRDRKSRLDTVVGSASGYWSMLSDIISEIREQEIKTSFQDWCEIKYGFRPIYDQDGAITGQPDIIDPQKYTLCLLKYSG